MHNLLLRNSVFIILLSTSGISITPYRQTKPVIVPKISTELKAYFENLCLAELEMKNQHFSKALEMGINAEKHWKPTYELIELKLKCYLELGKYEKAKELMVYEMENFNAHDYYFISSYYGIKKDNPIAKYLHDKEIEIQNKIPKEKNDLKYQWDQIDYCFSLRYNNYFSYPEFLDTNTINKLRNKYKTKDNSIIENDCIIKPFESLIEKVGFPDLTNVCSNTSNRDLILIRFPIKNKEILLDSALVQGKIHPYFYAYIYDRCFNTNFYGTKMAKNEASGRICLDFIPDVKNVDKRRKSIGLPPLFLSYSDLEFSTEYKQLQPDKK
jgi:hypothetical protein